MDLLKFPENCLDVLAQFAIGLSIIREWDIDEGYELVTSSWPYRSLPYDDYIEVLDLLDEERRIWVDWEENRFGKRGFAQMIYCLLYTSPSPRDGLLSRMPSSA